MDATAGKSTAGRRASATSLSKTQTVPSEARLDYARVIKLFTNEHTAELQDRQMAAIRRVVRVNADG